MFSPTVSQIPPAMSAARKLLTAGQVRAQRLLDKIESQCKAGNGSDRTPYSILEIGALRAMVRNLCAELAAFEPEDGSVEVEFNGHYLFVHIESEQIQANGFDISGLLSKDDKAAILCIAEEKQREQNIVRALIAREELRMSTREAA